MAQRTPMTEVRIFGLETGGTHCRCAVGDAAGTFLAQADTPTTTPQATLAAVRAQFEAFAARFGPPTALGVAAFGPIAVIPGDPDYGRLARTPKPGWSGFDLLGALDGVAPVVGLATDVEAAARAEALWGAGRSAQRLAYVTVGGGVGVGVADRGRPIRGGWHLEMGHVRVPRAPGDEAFAGVCPFHGDCLEGLASGPAIAARWDAPAETLGPDHPAWAIQAYYLAELCAVLVYAHAPDRILLGGGVMAAPGLRDRVRGALARRLNGYAFGPALDLAALVGAPGLGRSAGVHGALAVALEALHGAGATPS